MSMNDNEIVQRIASAYPGSIIDVAGEDCNFEVYVISDDFSSMNTLQRQKSILALFKEEITTGKLHALSVRAKTSQEQSSSSGLIQIQP